MAAGRGQTYRFAFVHEDGAGLGRVVDLFGERKIEASVDGVFELADVNAAMAKVAGGGSKGKTILRIA
jgi:NADPH:quinone reductase-like Zn-dependent oxidoreductase